MRDCPWVSIKPQPSRNPAAAETMIAVSSNDECAVTKVKKFGASGLAARPHLLLLAAYLLAALPLAPWAGAAALRLALE